MADFLCFDVSGRYATFKTPETTRSALTFPFPPRTAILGLIGAILGLPRNSYWEPTSPFRNSIIALEILQPGRRFGITVNFTQTKYPTKIGSIMVPIPSDPETQRGMNTQQRLDLLVEPRFRLYIDLHNDDLMDELEIALREHLFTYPPYLGHANMLAEVDFISRFKYRPLDSGEHVVSSIVALSSDNHMKISGDFVLVHGVPMSMKTPSVEAHGEYIHPFGSADLVDSVAYQIKDQERPVIVNTKKKGVVACVESRPKAFVVPLPIASMDGPR